MRADVRDGSFQGTGIAGGGCPILNQSAPSTSFFVVSPSNPISVPFPAAAAAATTAALPCPVDSATARCFGELPLRKFNYRLALFSLSWAAGRPCDIDRMHSCSTHTAPFRRSLPAVLYFGTILMLNRRATHTSV